MLRQLPQCLCIHLQRLTWSSEGTPIKRQEHVQFTEYLSMDRYKHSGSTQRAHRTKCNPSPLKAENSDGFMEKTTANGTGMAECFRSSKFFGFQLTFPAYICCPCFIIHQGSIGTTTTNLFLMEPARLCFFARTHSSASPAITGECNIQEQQHREFIDRQTWNA